jgi:hypothetical protein
MILAFSGSRRGMTRRQKRMLLELLDEFLPVHVRHGAAIGADAEFHALCLHNDVPLIEVFPSDIPRQSMSVIDEPPTGTLKVHPPRDPLFRNRHIVTGADLLIACPSVSVEVLRSGTWATIRYADSINVKTIVIKPQDDGVQTDGSLAPGEVSRDAEP